MRCTGKYIISKQEHDCALRWSCRNFSIKTKPKRETPRIKGDKCEYYIKTT